VPRATPGCSSVWAQYTLRLPGGRRDAVADRLKVLGIPTAIHYPRPLHRQPAFDSFPVAGGGLAISEQLADEVLSLPMHPYLDEQTQDRIVIGLRDALAVVRP
jgi:dTDP-4-amino-4,6-dideoxygalactose transaminase